MDKQEKLAMHTANLADDNFAVLSAMFPNAVTETITGHDETGEPIIERAIDADVLAQEINTHVVSGKEERYQFNWPDKKKSMLLANAPTSATLRPCREESVDFDNTENLYIEGDNLDVLKLLRETYLNRVKMIYIDPPYNTGNDFIYEDDFSEKTGEFLQRDSQYDQQGNRLTSNLDSNGRFHTDWLNMIYPRLRVARDLLTDDGVIFISIDDKEAENLRKLCNEIFGERNFIAQIVWEKVHTRKNSAINFSSSHEYILCYAKIKRNKSNSEIGFVRNLLPRDNTDAYNNPDNDPKGPWKADPIIAHNYYSADYQITKPNGVILRRPQDGYWRYSEETLNQMISEKAIIWGEGNGYPLAKRYLCDVQDGLVPVTLFSREFAGDSSQAKRNIDELFPEIKGIFDYTKPVKLLLRLLQIGTNDHDIILDFFSGSATTAHAVMKLNAENSSNRKFIMVQLPEETTEGSEVFKLGYKNICEIGKERIRRAGTKIKEEAGLMGQDLDVGFRVLKLGSSNMKEVYYTPEEYSQISFNLDGFMDNIKPDRSDEDLLFQVMLDLGIPLSATIEQDGEVFSVNDNYLIACFGIVDTTMITEIAQKGPYYAVFRDSSFANDSALVNVEQVFNTYSPSTIRRVL